MFENLSNKLDRAFKVLKGQGRITEINVASTIKEIRRALIDADVSYKVAKEITSKIKDEAMGQNVLISVSPGQLLTKIVADELTELMGGESAEISLDGNPNIILLSGLQGSGKTTFTGKLGRYLKKKGKKTLLVACDVYRPAAIEQLHVIGDDLKIEVFSDPKSKSPLNIAKKLHESGVTIIGTSPYAIDLAENRDKFGKILSDLDIPAPKWGTAFSNTEAK